MNAEWVKHKKGMVNMSYNKLKGRIKEVFGNQCDFAAAMDMNPASLSAKLNNKAPWKREEIEKACMLLHIPLDQVHLYFFTPKVENSQQSE